MNEASDLRALLAGAAAVPETPVSLEQISARVRRRRRYRQVASSAITLTAAAVLVVAGPIITASNPSLRIDQEPHLDGTSTSLSRSERQARAAVEDLPGNHDLESAELTKVNGIHLLTALADHGEKTCMYMRAPGAPDWTGGCKRTSDFLSDGWMILVTSDSITNRIVTALRVHERAVSVHNDAGPPLPVIDGFAVADGLPELTVRRQGGDYALPAPPRPLPDAWLR